MSSWTECRLAAVLLLIFTLAGCSRSTLTPEDARQMLDASDRFNAPNVVRVMAGYCSTVEPPGADTSSGLGRLKALADAGAIRIARRAAAPNECTSLPGGLKERLTVSLGDAAGSFHPHALEDGAGWEFILGRRHIVRMDPVSYNRDDDPTLARMTYQWAWRAELLGQLLQVSEDPVNAQATFTRVDGAWSLRDPGF